MSTAIPPAFAQKGVERWCTNNKVGLASLDPPKAFFSEDYICPLIFAQAPEIDKNLLAHTPPVTGVVPTIFNNEHSKFGLKFSVRAPITLGQAGSCSLLWG